MQVELVKKVPLKKGKALLMHIYIDHNSSLI